MEVLSASFGGVIKQQIKMRRCPIKLKIQLKILIALITLVDRICLLILLSCTILFPPLPSQITLPPPPLSHLLLSLAFHQCSSALPCNRRIIALPSVPREMQVKRVMIATAFVGHDLGLGSESTFETYDALCM